MYYSRIQFFVPTSFNIKTWYLELNIESTDLTLQYTEVFYVIFIIF